MKQKSHLIWCKLIQEGFPLFWFWVGNFHLQAVVGTKLACYEIEIHNSNSLTYVILLLPTKHACYWINVRNFWRLDTIILFANITIFYSEDEVTRWSGCLMHRWMKSWELEQGQSLLSPLLGLSCTLLVTGG